MAWYSGISKALSFFGARSPTPNTQPNGGDGVQAYAGWLASDERHPALIGQQKWLTFANAHHTAIVATGLRYRSNLLASAKWHAEANPRGGRDAERAVDIVTQGLLSAQLPRPWPLCVRKASMFQVNGFSLHEWSIKRRDDGMVVFADLGHRPPHTVQRWDKPSEQAGWQAVAQLTRAGNEYIIPRNRLWYCWDDTLTDMPDGVGLMRHVIELVRRLGVLEGLEGVAYETDVRGMPIGRAPIEELRKLGAGAPGVGEDAAKIKSFIADRTANLRANLENIVKSPDKLQWLMLDSATYRSADQNSVTAVQKWAFDLLRGDAKGLMELNTVIGRLQVEIARVFGIEFVMMGAGSSGSKAMHADKTSMLAASLNGALSEMAASATRDLARPLVALNGLNPDTCTPTLVAEPIDSQDVTTACQALLQLSQAGLQPNDPATNVVRSWIGLPDAPEPDPGMLGMGAGVPGDSGGPPPNPDDGEVDVPVDDLEEAPPVEKYAPDQSRDEGGRWSSGGGGSGGPRAWTRAFDSRDHMRQIGEHQETEDHHRDQAAKLTGQIKDLRGRMQTATPGRAAQMQGRLDRLAEVRDGHRQAAAAARTQRAVVRQDLETQRSAHAAGLRADAAQRREAEATRATAEREGIGVIGRSRIGGPEGHPDVEPVAEVTPTVTHMTEREAQQRAAALHERLTAESNARLAAEPAKPEPTYLDRLQEMARAGSRTEPTPARPTPDRTARDRASDERARARNAAAKPADHPGLHAVSLPHAEIHRQNLLSRAGASLRSLISRKGMDAEIVKFVEDALADLDGVVKFDPDQPRDDHGRWGSGGGGGGGASDTKDTKEAGIARELRNMRFAMNAGDFDRAESHLNAAKAIDANHSRVQDADNDYQDATLMAGPPPGYGTDTSRERGPLEIAPAEYQRQTLDYVTGLSDQRLAALASYTNHTDRILNPLLRSSAGSPDPEQKIYGNDSENRRGKRSAIDREYGVAHDADTKVGEEIAKLDAAITSHHMDRTTETYRVLDDPGGKILGALKDGDTFRDHGYVSTTASREILDGFYKPSTGEHARVDMHIRIPKGAAAAPISGLSKYGNEQELLLPRGSSFRVTKIVPASSDRHKEVHVELIPENHNAKH